MIIHVKIKNIYGTETIYPACEKSKLFVNLLKQTTLTRRDIQIIKALGYEIEIVSDAISL